MKVYLLQGVTGEYSDTAWWEVRCYLSKDKAEDDKKELEEWVKENPDKRRDCPLDPRFSRDYTGTFYYVSELDLDETDHDTSRLNYQTSNKASNGQCPCLDCTNA